MIPAARLTDRETSREAALSVVGSSARDRRLVLHVLNEFGNCTADEVTAHLLFTWGITRARNCVSSRLSELARGGFVWATSERRLSPAGRPVTVWEITVEGREALR